MPDPFQHSLLYLPPYTLQLSHTFVVLFLRSNTTLSAAVVQPAGGSSPVCYSRRVLKRLIPVLSVSKRRNLCFHHHVGQKPFPLWLDGAFVALRDFPPRRNPLAVYIDLDPVHPASLFCLASSSILKPSSSHFSRACYLNSFLTYPVYLLQIPKDSGTEGLYIHLHHRPLTPDDDRASPHAARIISSGALEPSGDEFLPEESLTNATIVTVLNAGSSYVIDGLLSYRKYTLFLVPFSEGFEGQPSNSKTFVTPEATPSAPPAGVSVHLTNVTSASVVWGAVPLHHQNGPITAYHVEAVGADGTVVLSKRVGGAARSLHAHNLTLGDSYHITVAAETKSGRGPYSAPVSLHVDPVVLHPVASGTLTALDGEVWVIGVIGAGVFLLLLATVAVVVLYRRHARHKAFGVPSPMSCHKADRGSEGLDASLWQEYSGWHLEKVCGGSAGAALHLPPGDLVGGGGGEKGEVKVLNTGGVVECNGVPSSIPRNLVTFYRGASGVEGPYATTSILVPNSLPHPGHPKGVDGGPDGSLDKHKAMSERSFYTTDGNASLVGGGNKNAINAINGINSLGSMTGTGPPLPYFPPPGVPHRDWAHVFYSGSRAPSLVLSEGTYSEAHFAPTASPRPPCYAPRGPPFHHPSPCHVYASASSVVSQPGLPPSGDVRNSGMYESASMQYAPAGYYLQHPASMTSSFTSNASEALTGTSCVTPQSKDLGIQSSLPSLTYEALKALGEDIQAFRQSKMSDDEEPKMKPLKPEDRTPSLPPPSFDIPNPPPSAPSSSPAHQTPAKKRQIKSLPHRHPRQAFGGGPALTAALMADRALPPIDLSPAPLGEVESCGDDDEDLKKEDDACSECSCSCGSEAESSLYAETDFADDARRCLKEEQG